MVRSGCKDVFVGSMIGFRLAHWSHLFHRSNATQQNTFSTAPILAAGRMAALVLQVGSGLMLVSEPRLCRSRALFPSSHDVPGVTVYI